MKKLPPVALLCAGNLTDSAITRFQGLGSRLGPVKSTSLRLASRFANILRAGYAVDDYSRFPECSLIVVAVPDAVASRSIGELSRARLDFTHHAAVLCSTALGSEDLGPLAELGARTASVCETPARGGRLFVAEGDREAIKLLRPVIEGAGKSRAYKIVSLPPGRKKFYHSAIRCTGPLFSSLLTCADEFLKLAGIESGDADELLQVNVERTTRSFLQSGRRLAEEPADLERQVAALRARDPALADFFQHSAKLVRRIAK